jgi:hypothetical protein
VGASVRSRRAEGDGKMAEAVPGWGSRQWWALGTERGSPSSKSTPKRMDK